MLSWHSGMPEDEARRELSEAAAQRWGRERLPALDRTIEQTARWLWLVSQEPLDPLDEEPDFVLDRGPSHG